MPFGLETMHKVCDITMTVNVAFIEIQPQIELPQDIKNEILEIHNIPGYEISFSNSTKTYYITLPNASDKLATAERIAIGLEEKGLAVLRLTDNCVTQVTCQSFLLV
jgi:hypothetical protein